MIGIIIWVPNLPIINFCIQDSLGNLQKAACYYQESEHNQLVYDPVRRLENDILYVPMYLNEVYTVTDTTLSLRYKFDYSEFTPFEKEKIATFENYDELRDYRFFSYLFIRLLQRTQLICFFLQVIMEMNVWYRFMTSVLKNCCKYPEYSVILILFLILLRVFMLTKITLSQ